jgi:hypothetical protein
MSPRRLVVSLLLVLAFGLAAGFFKGNDIGIRGEIGNLSAPWLVVAFAPAWTSRSVVRGAFVGLASTLVALVGFYAALTVVLAGHLGGGGYLSELSVELHANRVYFAAGVMSGPLFGALGALIGRRRPDALWVLVGAVLAGEVIAVAVGSDRQLAPPPLYFNWAVTDWRPYILEAAVGVVIMIAGFRRWRPLRAG